MRRTKAAAATSDSDFTIRHPDGKMVIGDVATVLRYLAILRTSTDGGDVHV